MMYFFVGCALMHPFILILRAGRQASMKRIML